MDKKLLLCLAFLFAFSLGWSQDTSQNEKPCTIKPYQQSNGKYMVGGTVIRDYRLGGVMCSDMEANKEFRKFYRNNLIGGWIGLGFTAALVITTVRLFQNKNVFPYVAAMTISIVPMAIFFNKAHTHLAKAIAIYNSHL